MESAENQNDIMGESGNNAQGAENSYGDGYVTGTSSPRSAAEEVVDMLAAQLQVPQAVHAMHGQGRQGSAGEPVRQAMQSMWRTGRTPPPPLLHAEQASAFGAPAPQAAPQTAVTAAATQVTGAAAAAQGQGYYGYPTYYGQQSYGQPSYGQPGYGQYYGGWQAPPHAPAPYTYGYPYVAAHPQYRQEAGTMGAAAGMAAPPQYRQDAGTMGAAAGAAAMMQPLGPTAMMQPLGPTSPEGQIQQVGGQAVAAESVRQPTPEDDPEELTIKNLNINQIVKIAADTARKTVEGMTKTLTVAIGPPTALGDNLLKTRRRLVFSVYLYHIGSSESELWRGGASIAAMARVPCHNVVYVDQRLNRPVGLKLPPTFQPRPDMPETVVAEYQLTMIPNWSTLIQLHSYQFCQTWLQWNAVVSAVERSAKLELMIKRLGTVQGLEESCHLDYRWIKSEHRHMLYTECPKRDQYFQDDMTHDARMVGWMHQKGIAWNTEMPRSLTQANMPLMYRT